jgi:thiamine pyrophosphate-dependent acetolactate synthase large subunit-like protein
MSGNEIEKPNRKGNPRLEWASDVMAEMLRRLDLKYLAMNPGASYRGLHDSLVNYLGNRDPQMLLCLNEDHAVAIAHGYARVTGEPMGCLLHSNVGLMHGLMEIFNAWCARMPMVVIGATGPKAADLRRPWVDWVHTAKDQGALLRHFTKWDDEPASVKACVESLLRANQIARTAPRGPVYVCLDAGLQEERLDEAPVLPDLRRYVPGPSPRPSIETLETIAKRLVEAQRPIILCGRASRTREDWDRRVALAESLGALVLTDLRTGASFPTEHPLHVSPPRPHYPPAAAELVRQADAILVLDSIDLAGTLSLIEAGGAVAGFIINCSADSYVHNGWSMDYQGLPAVDLRVMADPDSVIEGLLPVVKALAVEPQTKWPGYSAKPSPTEKPDFADPQRAVTQADLSSALDRAREGRDFTLVRTGLGFASEYYPFRDPLDFLGFDGGGGLGAGPGMAIGAGLALRDSGRLAITIVGDGDFLQGATSLWTAAHYRIPVLVIVANNRSNFNDEIHQAEVAKHRGRPIENKWIGMRMTDPVIDIAGLARDQGVASEGPIEHVGDLAAALERALVTLERGEPYLLDVIVAQSERGPLVSRVS